MFYTVVLAVILYFTEVPEITALIRAKGQPILNHTLTLVCVTTGSVESIIWMYGPFPLYVDKTKILSKNNASLTFSPVMHSDKGTYWCKASNKFSSNSSDFFTLDVFCEYCTC